jgi:hypothetical protein
MIMGTFAGSHKHLLSGKKLGDPKLTRYTPQLLTERQAPLSANPSNFWLTVRLARSEHNLLVWLKHGEDSEVLALGADAKDHDESLRPLSYNTFWDVIKRK